jgi:hypothetical protein
MRQPKNFYLPDNAAYSSRRGVAFFNIRLDGDLDHRLWGNED